MRYALKKHPDSPCEAVSQISVEPTRLRGGQMKLHYAVELATSGLLIPPPAAPERKDELWRHTCLEVFIRAGTGDNYTEFNFSPSTEWAAYRFRNQRSGMRNIEEIDTPLIEVGVARALEMYVTLDLSRIPDLPAAEPWRVGVSAIIEETSERKSFWALAHAPDKPDFHHPNSFALHLPSPNLHETEQT
jgi:hypothetical protein